MGCLGCSPDQVGARLQAGRERLDNGTQSATEPVALDGVSHVATDDVRDTRGLGGIAADPGYRDRAALNSPSTAERGKSCPVAHTPDQAESRWRPFSRRAFRMARPARVRMRRRNPWVLARRRLLGWNVRLPLLTVFSPGLKMRFKRAVLQCLRRVAIGW